MISCDQHDYVEIACMYRYPILISLKSGEEISGTAKDTVYDNERQECIAIEVNGEQELVVLAEVKKIKVTIENPHFEEVSFTR